MKKLILIIPITLIMLIMISLSYREVYNRGYESGLDFCLEHTRTIEVNVIDSIKTTKK